MGTTIMRVKFDEITYSRIKIAAHKANRTPYWLIQQSILKYLLEIEEGNFPIEIPIDSVVDDTNDLLEDISPPFTDFAENILPQSALRSAITSDWLCPETTMIPLLQERARIPEEITRNIHRLSYNLAKNLRYTTHKTKSNGILQKLLQEFSLSSEEGVALMCLAEALLRIPDKETRNMLIYDKLAKSDWKSHLGHSSSLFINAATWGLVISKSFVHNYQENHLSNSLNKVLKKYGVTLIRKSIDTAIRFVGKQFVTGETITEALLKARKWENMGFSYSYDMLGEAVLTSKDAKEYLVSYQQAIHEIGKYSNNRGIYAGAGISIKLSALHPRYNRAQYNRVITELYPRLKNLAVLAKFYDIGMNIDAEESERLEISLDLLEKLCFENELKDWNGIGFVIQAYQKRCYKVVDYLIDLAKRSNHRLMIRLVKGAYWDSEIKRSQIDGLADYPVYTRKAYTDISYLACARKLLEVPHLIYPQFATHNAHTLAAIYYLAGNNYYSGQYEFQCLHGMGELLYKQVVGKISQDNLNRACRIYAPVGNYEKLLSYLVRRLLENGANSSFVNRVADMSSSIDELIEDPVVTVEKIFLKEGKMGLPNKKIPLPPDLYKGIRINSSGIDMSNEHSLAELSNTLLKSNAQSWIAKPIIKTKLDSGVTRPIRNPSFFNDIVGQVREATEKEVSNAIKTSVEMSKIWSTIFPKERARILEKAGREIEKHKQTLISLLIRESGKTYNNAISEIREAADFLYYYASIIKKNFDNKTCIPLGSVICISPWNFPLAIFVGQVAAALAAGNSVLAKPAEQTPLIAAQAVKLLLESGIPEGVLQLLPGRGETVGVQLTCDERIGGVMFTGSIEVAKLLQHNIANRLDAQGYPIPLIAETGGLNAMIVDSSALTEQVVIDILTSAFDSAGQRCSALRLLCIQEDVANYTIEMLRGALLEYRMGKPEYLSVDIGPVIDVSAKTNIEHHIQTMLKKGFKVYQAVHDNLQDSKEWLGGNFVKPTIIEINEVSDLEKEIFGPVLHILRFSRAELPKLINQINSAGYGLTLGVHSRINETITQVTNNANVGNIYVNRNMVGAVVGVQPFGGEGLSGTGPKAGGVLYLYRLLSSRPDNAVFLTLELQCLEPVKPKLHSILMQPHQSLIKWAKDKPDLLAVCNRYLELSLTGIIRLLPGPTGERNTISFLPRHRILCIADNEKDVLIQLAAATSTGSHILWEHDELHFKLKSVLPNKVQKNIDLEKNVLNHSFDVVIYHGDSERLRNLSVKIATRPGAIIPVQGFPSGATNLMLERLLLERSLSINTAAAGGNTALMTIELE